MAARKVNLVFAIAAGIVLLIAIWGLALPDSFEAAAGTAFSFIVTDFGWLYMLSMVLYVGFALWIGFFSKFKNMRLGPDDSRPAYSTRTWFAMLFSAGMGIGLVFWSVAEPLNFFAAPLGADPGSGAAAEFAFGKAFLHWGLHPWANYAVMALALAYVQFRRGRPALISALFTPLLGEKLVNGPLGKAIDIMALLATAGGVCTTLGLGVLQVNSGMSFLMGIPLTPLLTIGTVVVLTVIFVATAVAGVEKGSSRVSNLNIAIACLVMVFLFFAGPTVDILNNLTEGIGAYAKGFVDGSFDMGAFGDAAWYGDWTIFYWAWWIAWAPFTGSFIARISRGRTVKEFVAGVMFLPAIASILWFAVFGTLGMDLGLGAAREAIQSTATALFVVLQHYPLGTILCFVMLVLVCTFFCSSATSATIVLGMYSERGTMNPSAKSKIVWGLLLAVLSLSIMLSGDNGIDLLKTLCIVVGFPFVIIKTASLFSLTKELRCEDTAAIERAYRASLLEKRQQGKLDERAVSPTAVECGDAGGGMGGDADTDADDLELEAMPRSGGPA